MSLTINGIRKFGLDIQKQNIQAVTAISNIIKSSLGPVGLDKLLVDELGDVTITNDGATILKKLEVEHPAAKLLVELSALQDSEVGDGTTSVVIIASELLKCAHELVKQHIHPTIIISGYQQAKREAVKFIVNKMTKKVSTVDSECLINAAKTSISSKLIGKEGLFFAKMTVDAIKSIKIKNSKGEIRYPVKAINILKLIGGALKDSKLINGFALENTLSSDQMPKNIKGAKIAMIDFDLRKKPLKFGIQMIITDPDEIEKLRQTEIISVEKKCELLLRTGANVILTTGGIDEIAMQYMVDKGIMGIRRISKKRLRRIAKLTNGELLTSFADFGSEEKINSSSLGIAKKVIQQRVGDRDIIFIMSASSTSSQTIILRGANYYMLDEIERSLHDSLCCVKRVLESKRVVPGGGAIEVSLSIYLKHLSESIANREQLAISEFAKALLIIPKTLALNGTYDSIDLIAQLKSFHNVAQIDNTREKWMYTGLNLNNGRVRNNFKAGVLEPAISKIKSIKFATEAAITILRIDDSITIMPEKKSNMDNT